MFLDASAIVGILNHEPEANELKDKINKATSPFSFSAICFYEATLAVARQKSIALKCKITPELLEGARQAVSVFLEALEAKEIVISNDIGQKAIAVSGIYGKIIGHKAELNFGDCFAYACAKSHKLPLLYKGNDFAHTDLV
jgi:ribonuclease VapC